VRPRYSILIAAALVYVIGQWVPFGDYALYPLTLFTTWVHEMGHGLSALIAGGEFDSLAIYRDASGLAHAYASRGWPEAFVCIGGLLAPPFLGSVLIATVHGPRRARIVLGLIAAALVLSLVVWVRSTAGLVAMPIVAILLGWAAGPGFKDAPERRVIVAQVLAVVLALDTLTRMVHYVFTTSVDFDGKPTPSDIQIIEDNLGGSYVLWGLAICVIAVAMLGAAAWWAWGRSEKVPQLRKTVP
jgi:hypothetical protein